MTTHAFWKLAEEDPSHVAVVEPDGRKVTAGELLRASNRVVHGLRALGMRHGDKFAVMMSNEGAVLELYMAAVQAGFYMTPINSHLTAAEVAYILSDCEAKAVFASEKTVETVAKAASQLGFPKEAMFSTASSPGFASFSEWKEKQSDATPTARAAGASMTYTSGTTGKPKGVYRKLADAPPEAVAEQNAMFLRLFGITPRESGVHLVVAPLYHTVVLNFATNHLHFGHTVVLMDKWTAEGTLERIQRYRVTTSHMVPTQFRRLLAMPEKERAAYDVSSLRHVIHGAAPCSPDVKRGMLDAWGDVIFEYYAASEGGGTLATPKDARERPGTVGKAWPISRLRIAKDDGTVCAPREVGTVYISMGAYKFEYHKDKKKTDESFRDEFFTVGDAGYLDEDGYLFLCDRKSDMIISGGVNIYPAEIEAALVMHPKVQDVAVFGIPDEDWGEHVKAVIEPAAGVEPGPALAEELLAYCKEHIASFKCPRSIDFLPALPRDPNGKLYKRKLRDPYWEGRSRAI